MTKFHYFNKFECAPQQKKPTPTKLQICSTGIKLNVNAFAIIVVNKLRKHLWKLDSRRVRRNVQVSRLAGWMKASNEPPTSGISAHNCCYYFLLTSLVLLTASYAKPLVCPYLLHIQCAKTNHKRWLVDNGTEETHFFK